MCVWHLFGSGTGIEVVCGDTDSIFVCFTGILRSELVGKPRLEETFRFCHILADAVNVQMHAPKKIEVEKVCVTILNCDKKRYAAVLMTSPTAQPKFDVKGMQCVRRNGCALVRNNVRSTLETLVGDRDVDAAIAGVKAIVDNVIEDKLPRDVYVMRQVLRKVETAYPKPPQHNITQLNQTSSSIHALVAFCILETQHHIAAR